MPCCPMPVFYTLSQYISFSSFFFVCVPRLLRYACFFLSLFVSFYTFNPCICFKLWYSMPIRYNHILDMFLFFKTFFFSHFSESCERNTVRYYKQPVRCNNNNYINNFNQLNMFRALISPILKSTTLCLQSSAPEDGRNYRPKHVELIEITNKIFIVASDWLFILNIWLRNFF